MRHGRSFVVGGFRPVIVKEGPKWSQVVFIDGTHVKMRRIKGHLDIQPIEGYPLRKMALRMLRRTNVLGLKQQVSKAARTILEEAKAV